MTPAQIFLNQSYFGSEAQAMWLFSLMKKDNDIPKIFIFSDTWHITPLWVHICIHIYLFFTEFFGVFIPS